MLTHLHIENFAVISDIDVDFVAGMNVILGETGAGKSILMDALSLLAGARSEFEKIRFGEDKAFIEGTFVLHDSEHLALFEERYSDYLDGDTFLLSRTLLSSGKSIQRINGRSVPLLLMKDIMKEMMDIYSQDQNPFYFNEKNHTFLLDHFLPLKDEEKVIFSDYKNAYDTYCSLKEEVEHYEVLLKRKEDKDYLLYQYNELENAAIKEHEMEDLESQLSSLSSIMNLSEKKRRFQEEANEAANHLFLARKVLETMEQEDLKDDKENYIDAFYRLEDAKNNLDTSFEDILKRVEHIDEMKNRLQFLHALKRKYGSSTEEILEKKEEIKKTLDEFDNASYYLDKRRKELFSAEEILKAKENSLWNLRKQRAKILEENMRKELEDLLFFQAEFQVDFYESKVDSEGIHKARFLLKTNVGMNFLPLYETASLGEASRLGLAFKKIFLDQEKKETLIFDEIDIGLSGKASLSVGKKIHEISSSMQVLVITHLPQVAIHGDYHFLVTKSIQKDKAASSIVPLKKEEMVEEIAKMISGGELDKKSKELVLSWLKN